MEKISVIIPVYNVAPYLKDCLESVINQTFTNIEIILINDGSTDDSLAICEQYHAKDPRIKIINQTNQGVAAARNAGIEAAKGTYLTFIDSDDWYDSDDALQILYQAMMDKKTRIAVCAFNEFNQSQNEYELFVHTNQTRVYSVAEWFSIEYRGQLFSQCFSTIWGILFDRKLFHHVRFPVGKFSEDDLTLWRIYRLVQDITLVEKPLYIYRNNRKDSLTNIPNIGQFFPLTGIEQRITIDRLINQSVDIEKEGYLWRLYKRRLDTISNTTDLERYKHALIKKQILDKYSEYLNK